VLAGDAVAGIPGMFFSIPAIAIVRVLYTRLQDASERARLVQSSRVQEEEIPSHARKQLEIS